jgi:hypothetical protein
MAPLSAAESYGYSVYLYANIYQLTVEDYYLKFPPSSSSKSGEYPFILRAVLFFSKDGFWAFANTCEGALIYHFYVFVLFNLVYFPRSAHL